MGLSRRDIFFFLERVSEQTNSILKIQYKKRFGFFRNFKIKGGNIRMVSYVLRTITKPTEVFYTTSVYAPLSSVFCNYHIRSLPCLFFTYDISQLNVITNNQYSIVIQDKVYNVSKLNFMKNDQYSVIAQELIYNVNELNTQVKSCVEELSCLVNYTITKQ